MGRRWRCAIFVTAGGDSDLGSGSGSVYVFVWNGSDWIEQGKLNASDGVAGDRFGAGLALRDDLAVMGAYKSDAFGSLSGSAYVFVRDGDWWTEEAKLLASDGSANSRFGWAVAIHEEADEIAIGAENASALVGQVYLFGRGESGWEEKAILRASDAASADAFGNAQAVGFSGDTIIVGATEKTLPASTGGSAYIFERDGEDWVEQIQLINNDPPPFALFGTSVAIGEDLAVVLAGADDSAGYVRGAVYLYRREGMSWNLQLRVSGTNKPAEDVRGGNSVSINGQFIITGDPSYRSVVRYEEAPNDWTSFYLDTPEGAASFGRSVSGSGEYILVGAPKTPDLGIDAGSAYIFRQDPVEFEWFEEFTILPSDGAPGDLFGRSVYLDGDLALVGAPLRDDETAGDNSGAVYAFTRQDTSWIEGTTLIPADAEAGDEFGWSVSQDAGYAVIGAPNDDDAGLESGAAYVFVYNGQDWTEDAKLLASDGMPGDLFGLSVSIKGDVIVVGAEREDVGGTTSDSGAAYLFRLVEGVWIEERKLVSAEPTWSGRFGSAVAISDDFALVGSVFGDDARVPHAGAAFFFDFNVTDCDDDGVADSCGPDCNANGVPDGCDIPPLGLSLDCNLDSVPDECQVVDSDCNANGIPDDCDLDINEDGVPDDCCTDNAFCDDASGCTFDRCVENVCQYTPAIYGDVAATGSGCGPDGTVDLADILALLDGFQGVFATGCEVSNVDIASQSDGCTSDGTIDLSDILAVLDAFQGATTCCPDARNGPFQAPGE